MKNAYKNLRECIKSNPAGLSFLPDKVKVLTSSYIPYSTGIEVECTIFDLSHPERMKEIITKSKEIGFMNDGDIGTTESRFRLHTGEKGLVELFKMTELLKEYFCPNSQSGIHYHIDMNDVAKYIDYGNYDPQNGRWNESDKYEWVFKELDTWGYTGTFNKRMIGCSKSAWVRMCNYYSTMEFRIGEMTFDYQLIVKRILHCQSIVKRVKKQILKEAGIGVASLPF